MRKTKSYKLETILERRIAMGDYALLDFPAERKLAAAFNVTQMTARKAVKNLEKQGLLVRQANGTVTAAAKKAGTVAFLAPTFLSSHVFMYQKMLDKAAEGAGRQMRTVLYMHWDDAIIEETLERFDGVFLYPVRETMSERLADLLRETPTPVVALGADLSAVGIPSFIDQPANAPELIIDFLRERGYRKIDFLLTQPRGMGVDRWLENWRHRIQDQGLGGELFEFPVKSYGDSYEQAFRRVGELIERGAFNSTCLLGATVAEAIGACRALASHGIVPGRDVAVSSVTRNSGGLAEYYIPSIATVVSADCSGHLRQYLEWMTRPRSSWSGEMVRRGDDGQVFAGESVPFAAELKSREMIR